jgi:hypothetical protein
MGFFNTLFGLDKKKMVRKNSTNDLGVTFKVSDVKPAKKPIPLVSYKEALEIKTGRRIEAFPTLNRKLNTNSKLHGFIYTLHGAFNFHYPVVITPDMIWLLIAQGFAKHVNLHAESMRNVFVEHQSKKILRVRADHFVKGENNNWTEVFPQFTKEIESIVKSDLLELLVPTFSTTTAKEKAAFEVTMMDSMKAYFHYRAMTMCGIPEITVLGELKDWEKILSHTERLKAYGLDWWIDSLKPILHQFVRTSQGDIDKNFWLSMYKYESLSGIEKVTGWVVNFFPYLQNEYKTYRNPLKTPAHTDISNFPQGLSIVPFKWDYFGTMYDMEFISGFVGTTQEPENLRVSPEISWCVREAQ